MREMGFDHLAGHGLRAALTPIVTIFGLDFGLLIGSAVLTETVFAWPGLGLYITNALFAADMAAVMGGTIVVGVAFVTVWPVDRWQGL